MSNYVTKIRTDKGDLPIDYNALANLPDFTAMFSNPNLLINGDFRNPVNQRGITKYEGSTIKCYTIDRWCMGDQDYFRTVEIVDGGVTVTNPNETYIGTFQQIFEHSLPQGNYTLSVKVKEITSGGGTMSCGGSHSATKKELSVGVNTLTLTGATISSFLIYLAPSSSMTLEWAKLEYGTIATPFIPKPYSEELMLCRRYFCVVVPSLMIISRQRFDGSTSYFAGFPYPNVMRSVPGVIYESKTSDSSEVLTGKLGLTHDEFCAKFFSIEGDYDDVELTYMSLDAEIY